MRWTGRVWRLTKRSCALISRGNRQTKSISALAAALALSKEMHIVTQSCHGQSAALHFSNLQNTSRVQYTVKAAANDVVSNKIKRDASASKSRI
eukprot:2202812-Pleurochrysis_carterae.AAC.1